MKRAFGLILLLFLFLTACGGSDDIDHGASETGDPVYTEVDSDGTQESAAGWWTKPDGYRGLTSVYTFCMDDERGIATTYDDYGNAYEELECWYDECGFNMDAGELFGIVTFIVDGDELLDEDGNVHYVRCDPIDPGDAPFTLADLAGAWYKNGEDYEALVFENDRYRLEMSEIEMEDGTTLVTKHTTYYDASEYTGPAVYLEDESGFSDALWILEGGQLLYDDFHGEYYLPEGIGDGELAYLSEKYALIRDDWSSEDEGGYSLTFAFFGELWLHAWNDSGAGTTEVIGAWEMDEERVVSLNFADGTTEEIAPGSEIYLDNLGVSFTRWEDW